MNRRTPFVIAAAGGAIAYTVAKVDLAIRGELGMPGFPASAESYQLYDPVAGQLSNAGMGVLLAAVIATLAWSPDNTLLRRGLLVVNWLGVAMIAAGVVGFTARATALAPALGPAAEGAGAWIALSVAAIWVICWTVAAYSASTVRRRGAVPI